MKQETQIKRGAASSCAFWTRLCGHFKIQQRFLGAACGSVMLLWCRWRRGGCAEAPSLLQHKGPSAECLGHQSRSFLLSTLSSHSLYCYFSEGLNAEYVKGENMEAVVSEEPQGETFHSSPRLRRAPKAALRRDFPQAPRPVLGCPVSLVKTPL